MILQSSLKPNSIISPPFDSTRAYKPSNVSRELQLGNNTIKTHNEIFDKFAEESERLKDMKQKDFLCHNIENNNRQQNQDLHFAKRLTWNLPKDEKMQTSTDGTETPISEPHTNNLNIILSHSSSSNHAPTQFENGIGNEILFYAFLAICIDVYFPCFDEFRRIFIY